MSELVEALLNGCTEDILASAQLPETFRAAVIEDCDVHLACRGTALDVRETIKVREVPMPEVAPDEVVVALMASSINYNTVWSALFQPLPTFSFLRQLGRSGRFGSRHDKPFHVLGSDGAGIVVRTGESVRNWKVGDHVVIHTAYVDPEDPMSHHDGMLTADLRAWGYETNYGGLAEFTVVKATQLLRKARHLTWEEAACIPLCGGTAYRMLVSDRGAQMKQGDVVLIWGASGGVGAFAAQLVKAGGGLPVGVVSSEEKAKYAREQGCVGVIDRSTLPSDEKGVLTARAWRILRKAIRDIVGEDPHIVVETVGRATFGASVYLARRGGKIITCGSSSGYMHEFDNRYLWMNLKRIIGSHGANAQEAWETNRLVNMGMLRPIVSETYALADAAEATRKVQKNAHIGKVGVLCLAPEVGLGITDPEGRENLL